MNKLAVSNKLLIKILERIHMLTEWKIKGGPHDVFVWEN